jgi:hypothetical protein
VERDSKYLQPPIQKSNYPDPDSLSPLRFRFHLLRSLRYSMIGQRHCPFCQISALNACPHLALAAEARDFVRRCVDLCQAQVQWQTLCELRRKQIRQSGNWSPEREDFTWLETAFRGEFLDRLRWFGGMEYEWRTGAKPEQGGFYVLLWSREPKQLWWELREELERQASSLASPALPPRRGASLNQYPQSGFAHSTAEPWLINPPLSPSSRS